MIHKKRLFYPTLLAALTCGGLAISLYAQQPGGPPSHSSHRPPPSPLFDALDANHDGVISADEIANASTALKALLKDGATQITREDVRPPLPPKARDDRERDDQARPRPRPEADFTPWHRPPPRDDQDGDDFAPPPSHEDEDRQDHPRRRPLPPRPSEDDRGMDDEIRSRPQHADRDDRPPRPARDESAWAEGGPRPHPRARDREERPGHQSQPFSPLFDALDTNHDGVISADEIAAAPQSLKKLDKNGSGQIKREDLTLPPPPGEND